MSDVLTAILILAGWYFINRVIFPKMGIPT